MKIRAFALVLCGFLGVASASDSLVVRMNLVDTNGVGVSVGQIVATESKYGVVFTPALSGMVPGLHGFHVHEKASCAAGIKDGKMAAALGAGGHYDPLKSGKHGTPWWDGHLGDLPPIYVDPMGNASQPVLAPRLKLSDLAGRSLMIHMGGDNHSDHPMPLGGGGMRMVCGANP